MKLAVGEMPEARNKEEMQTSWYQPLSRKHHVHQRVASQRTPAALTILEREIQIGRPNYIPLFPPQEAATVVLHWES